MSPPRRDGSANDGDAAREDIMTCIRARPGISKSELCEDCGLSWGTISYHLRLLRQDGRVDLNRDGRTVRIFPQGVAHHQRAWIAVLRDERRTSILAALREEPGQGITDLQGQLGFSRKLIRRHLIGLREAGIVEMAEEGPRPRYQLASDEAPIVALRAPRAGAHELASMYE